MLAGRWLAKEGMAIEIAALLLFVGLLPAVHNVRQAASSMVST